MKKLLIVIFAATFSQFALAEGIAKEIAPALDNAFRFNTNVYDSGLT